MSGKKAELCSQLALYIVNGRDSFCCIDNVAEVFKVVARDDT